MESLLVYVYESENFTCIYLFIRVESLFSYVNNSGKFICMSLFKKYIPLSNFT